MLYKTKKGLAQYASTVLGFVLLIIIAVAGLSVLSEMQDTFGNTTAEYNASGKGVEGIEKITDFATLIGIIIAISIVIGILFGAFGGMLKPSGQAI